MAVVTNIMWGFLAYYNIDGTKSPITLVPTLNENPREVV